MSPVCQIAFEKTPMNVPWYHSDQVCHREYHDLQYQVPFFLDPWHISPLSSLLFTSSLISISASVVEWLSRTPYWYCKSNICLFNQCYVRRLEISGDGNTVNFMKCSSFSAQISFGQLPVKSVTKMCSKCRYSRFTDTEWAFKTRLYQLSEATGIPIQAWMTIDIALSYAIWFVIHVQISMMASPISLSNSSHRTDMAVHPRVS